MGESDALMFFCNGQKIIEPNPDPRMSLAVYLRTKAGLTGCKIGCNNGFCGTCTVMVSWVTQHELIRHIAVNACLYPLCDIYGKAVTTVEGIGSTKTKLHPVQERLAKCHGSQCGFCTPGMVMSMYTLLRNNPKPTSEEVLQVTEGNLCRCAGYRSILNAFNTFTQEGCCGRQQGNTCCRTDDSDMCTSTFDASDFTPYDQTQDIIFPPELLTNRASLRRTTKFSTDQLTWINLYSFEDTLKLKGSCPSAQIAAGSTTFGLLKQAGTILNISDVEELCKITPTDTGLDIGACVTMSQLREEIQDIMKVLPAEKTKTMSEISSILHRYGSQQIRNVATIGGHIMAAGSNYDLLPVLLAVGVNVTVVKTNGNTSKLPMDRDFYSPEFGAAVGSNEILRSVHIPFTQENEFINAYKMTRRRLHMDDAIVNAAFKVTLEPGSDVVKCGNFVIGGIGTVPIFATETVKEIVGRRWDKGVQDTVLTSISDEVKTSTSNTEDELLRYQLDLVEASFVKFFSVVTKQITKCEEVSRSDSNVFTTTSTTPRGISVYQPVPDDQPDIDPIGRPIIHRSALQQTSGEAVYVDDLPTAREELFLALVLPKRGRAKVLSIDTTKAMSIEGVVAFVNADDVTGVNKTLMEDAEFLVTEQVYSVCQIIGGVVATDPDTAQKAATLVDVTYEDLPVITTIEEAIEQNAFHQPSRSLEKGDLEKGFKDSAPNVIEGSVRASGQEHFYMEPTACIAIPSLEDDSMELQLAWHGLRDVQHSVAKALGVDASKIRCKTKRIGGSFGGKHVRCGYLVVCAIAANKVGKPVRMVLPRDVDMEITGNREASMATYKVGFAKSGRITVADVTVYHNWGCLVIFRRCCSVLFGIDAVYAMDNFRATVKNCATNLPAAKAMRAFGYVQSLFIMESIITQVAQTCGLPVLQVREINIHKEAVPSTYYGLPINDYNVFQRCWTECLEKSNYHNRRKQVDTHNSENRWNKRGLAIVPLKFQVGGYPLFLYQATAMVNAYLDGSVLLHHGGVEVGQGIHTKMLQIASRVLGIPVDRIHIADSNTDVINNPSETGASNSTDLWGMAVKDACETLNERLTPFKSSKPDGTFADWVTAAYMARTNLSAFGFFKPSGIDWDWTSKTGRPYLYSTFGAACTEVQIDCLTGNHELIRTDMVMDVGKSLNPAIDIGQIEGAFMMGYGYFVLEELLWDKDGKLQTNGPHNYKIPCIRDIPAQFNVTLLRNCPNPRAVYSSKGIGEPPLCLASSVHFALQDAIESARRDAGKTGVFSLAAPATADRIRKACCDSSGES
ncbi:xanthine dehydrogenase/oxidase-like [Amphiura filiformis]|uniref:xanthine dehydrogenase/oxidase-like n=1 Tax=Amphiura filiformis TaxID=82378 RepID=UPI003B214466